MDQLLEECREEEERMSVMSEMGGGCDTSRVAKTAEIDHQNKALLEADTCLEDVEYAHKQFETQLQS